MKFYINTIKEADLTGKEYKQLSIFSNGIVKNIETIYNNLDLAVKLLNDKNCNKWFDKVFNDFGYYISRSTKSFSDILQLCISKEFETEVFGFKNCIEFLYNAYCIENKKLKGAVPLENWLIEFLAKGIKIVLLTNTNNYIELDKNKVNEVSNVMLDFIRFNKTESTKLNITNESLEYYEQFIKNSIILNETIICKNDELMIYFYQNLELIKTTLNNLKESKKIEERNKVLDSTKNHNFRLSDWGSMYEDD